MSRFPTVSRQVEGVEQEAYDVGNVCSAPSYLTNRCDNRTIERHHLFSRGLMGGAFDWVRLQDGTVIGNIVGLCPVHHRLVTENKAHIMFENGAFVWYDNHGNSGPLSVQPPGAWYEVPATDAIPHAKREKCPKCGRAMPKPKDEKKIEGKKPRKTWACAVPKERLEDGADVIDALLEACEEKMDAFGLDWGKGDNVTYYKLTTVLGLFAQQGDAILSND